MATNNLGAEKSPYLLQHAQNPVGWYPWGVAAFERAKSEQKPIFLSIGYSTCYWCHVMERECFEEGEVAAVLNKNFVSIKVDREERPDVDQIYMDAVVALTGRGGWPMSVFLTPDLRPFFGGTYFPKEQFINLSTQISDLWVADRENVFSAATQLTHALKRDAQESAELSEQVFSLALRKFQDSFDPIYGGFGPAPKFPPATSLRLLLRVYDRSGDKNALNMVESTLQKMAQGGFYDQVGGGFHRYSTDRQWIVPHFEKMLYDNALLTVAYLEAFQITKNELYKEIAEGTLGYLMSKMRDDAGGFYSAEDAGEVGAEGEYYVWSHAELARHQKIVTQLSRGLILENNFEENLIIPLRKKPEPYSLQTRDSIDQLLQIREARVSPHKDKKILTSWNGLLLSAFAKAAQVSDREDFAQTANQIAQFIETNLFRDGQLLRRHCDGESAIPGFLEDYAFVIQGLLDLYETRFDLKWLSWAAELQQIQDKIFWDYESVGYFYAPSDPHLLIRKKEYFDGALPASNSISALNLSRIYHLTGEDILKGRAEAVIRANGEMVEKFPNAFSSLLIAVDFLQNAQEIILAGERSAQFSKVFQKEFLPNKVLALAVNSDFSILSDKATASGIFICKDGSCLPPFTYADEAVNELRRTRLP